MILFFNNGMQEIFERIMTLFERYKETIQYFTTLSTENVQKLSNSQ